MANTEILWISARSDELPRRRARRPHQGRTRRSPCLVPQLLRCLRHHQEDNRDLPGFSALRTPGGPPHPPSLRNSFQVPGEEEGRAARGVIRTPGRCPVVGHPPTTLLLFSAKYRNFLFSPS